MIDYASLAADVIDLLKEAGRPLILRRGNVADTYDEVTGTKTPGGPGGDTTFTGVTLSITESYAARVGTENIQTRDQLVYAGNEIEPKMTDVIVIDGEEWQIVGILPTSPAGIPVIYEIQVRP